MLAVAQRLQDDHVLRTIQNANNPRNVDPDGKNHLKVTTPRNVSRCTSGRSRMSVSRGSSASHKSRESRPSSRRPPSRTPSEKAAEEEKRKRQKYWEKWAAVAAQALLEQIKEEQPEKELMYTANIGEKPRVRRYHSQESIKTNLSLLTCSSGTPAVRINSSRASTPKKTSTESKPDWVRLANERKSTSLLSRLMRQSSMAVMDYQKGSRTKNYAIHGDMTDLMDQEEQDKLYACGRSQGLKLPHGIKSGSTPNVLSLIPEYRKTKHLKLRSYPRAGNVPIIIEPRTPSPLEIVKDSVREPRPESAATIRTQRKEAGDSIPNTPGGSSVFSSQTDRHQQLRKSAPGIPSLKRTMSKRVFSKIRKTAEALDRATGWGDNTDTCREITDEPVVYTDTDYSKVPKYPQEIRISPLLSSTIKQDIRHRMGRPRQHEIRTKDVKELDRDNPDLDRAHRNLLIFNWLITMDDVEYETRTVPEIYDLDNEEAVRPDTRRLLFPSVDGTGISTPKDPSPGLTWSEVTGNPSPRLKGSEVTSQEEKDSDCGSDCSSQPDPRFNYY